MTTATPEIIDAGTIAGRKEYRRLYQSTHDPRVARMVDDAVESALSAACPLIGAQAKAEALREAADALEAGWSYGAELNYDGSEKPGVAAAIQMTHENAEVLRARAATIEATP